MIRVLYEASVCRGYDGSLDGRTSDEEARMAAKACQAHQGRTANRSYFPD